MLVHTSAGNPLRSPPLELVMKGMRDVLFYLQVCTTQPNARAIELVENIFPRVQFSICFQVT